jgi:alanine racemase
MPICAEIDLRAISHNLAEVRRLVGPEVEIMAVVKANAYGHGLIEVARHAAASGAGWLGVARAAEGCELRRHGVEIPILVLGYTPPEQYAEILACDLAQAVYDFSLASALAEAARRAGRTVRVHLKIDTGMGRLGFPADEPGLKAALRTARLPGLEVEGIFTHFATADAADKTFVLEQLTRFREALAVLRRAGLEAPLIHAANSAAIIDLPESHFNMVRPGIMLYGLYPSHEVQTRLVDLRPAMTLKARIAMVKKVPGGFPVSYGCTHVTCRPTTLATIPAGYADGYFRAFANRSRVLVHGTRCRVVGTVCMDQIIADVGHVTDVAVGDEVVLFGRQGEATLPVDELAAIAGTINYEIVCAVSARVPRVYLR